MTRRRRKRAKWVPWVIVSLAVLVPVLIVGPAGRSSPLLLLRLVTDGLQEPVAMAGDPADPERLFVV